LLTAETHSVALSKNSQRYWYYYRLALDITVVRLLLLCPSDRTPREERCRLLTRVSMVTGVSRVTKMVIMIVYLVNYSS